MSAYIRVCMCVRTCVCGLVGYMDVVCVATSLQVPICNFKSTLQMNFVSLAELTTVAQPFKSFYCFSLEAKRLISDSTN